MNREAAFLGEVSSGAASMAEGRVAEIDRPRDGPRGARAREFAGRILRH